MPLMCRTSVYIYILSPALSQQSLLSIVRGWLCNIWRLEFRHLIFFSLDLKHEDILLVCCGRGGDERKGEAYTKGEEGIREEGKKSECEKKKLGQCQERTGRRGRHEVRKNKEAERKTRKGS